MYVSEKDSRKNDYGIVLTEILYITFVLYMNMILMQEYAKDRVSFNKGQWTGVLYYMVDIRCIFCLVTKGA